MPLPDPIFYRNRKGAVALSLDEGATILLPTDRRISLTDAWEEVAGDFRNRLTDWQRVQLEEHLREERVEEELNDLLSGIETDITKQRPPPDHIRDGTGEVLDLDELFRD